MEKKKIKLFIFGDSPSAHTGFGTVVRNIVLRLLKTGKYEIHCLGINYHGDPIDLHKIENLFIYPTTTNPYGFDRLLPLLFNVKPDLLFLVNDYDAIAPVPQILMQYKQQTGITLPVVFHFPVDGIPVYEEYVKFIETYITKPVVISNFGKKAFEVVNPNLKMDQIYHGVDPDVFYPIPEDKLKETKKQLKNKFIVLMVGVNQLRKAYPIAIDAFTEFAKDKDDVILFLHTQRNLDVGWNLEKIIKLYNIQDKVYFTEGIRGAVGIDTASLNTIYNVADVFLTTTLGEGFGIPILEAMAAGCPVIYHNVTSVPEVTGGNGIPISTAGNLIFPKRDRELIRPLPNRTEIVSALEKLYADKGYREELSKKSLAWVKEKLEDGTFNWDIIAEKFDNIFMDVLSEKEEYLELDEIL